MAILITGGAGYVGSHTAKALSRAGFEVVVADNLFRGHRWAVKWGPLEVVDLNDTEALRAVFRRNKIEAVLHFAALAYVGESMQQAPMYFRNNLEGSLSLLRVMREHAVNTIVFSSTCATYGVPATLPIRETDPQCPMNPYGESKKCVEQALKWFSQCDGLHYVALRYFNAVGTDPDGEIGELHIPETHLVPSIIECTLGQRERIDVFGTDFDTPDGTCVRDYVHVCDLANAHLLALKYLWSGGASTCLNLGTGQGYSVREMVRKVEEVTGRKVNAVDSPRRPGDPAVLVADAAAARQVLGWQAVQSTPDQIVASAWRWYSEFIHHAAK